LTAPVSLARMFEQGERLKLNFDCQVSFLTVLVLMEIGRPLVVAARQKQIKPAKRISRSRREFNEISFRPRVATSLESLDEETKLNQRFS
jgi:hypothetical protein